MTMTMRPHLTVWDDQRHECPGCGTTYASRIAADEPEVVVLTHGIVPAHRK